MTAQLGVGFQLVQSQQLLAIPTQVCPRPISHQGNPTQRELTAARMTNIALKCKLIGFFFNNGDILGVKKKKTTTVNCDNQRLLLVNDWLLLPPKKPGVNQVL